MKKTTVNFVINTYNFLMAKMNSQKPLCPLRDKDEEPFFIEFFL